MSESAATPVRIAAATALRQLGHALVGHEVDDELMACICRAAEELAAEVGGGPIRSRPVDEMKRDLFAGPPDDLERMDHFPDCVVSGLANPMGIAMRAHREGEEAVARVTLGPAFEGAPGRAHGGVVAAVFDDTMGFVLSMLRTPAFTGRLTVSYRAPTPVRKGVRIANAEGLFIAMPLDRFGLGATAAD